MDDLSNILNIANSIASIAAALTTISIMRKADKCPNQNDARANTIVNNESPPQNLNRSRKFENVVSLGSLGIGFSDLLFVMFGPPRYLPLTGESGALLAYGLIFIFLGFYLRH